MPGTLDESNNFVDNPLDKEPDGTTAIADDGKVIVVYACDGQHGQSKMHKSRTFD